MEQTLRMNHDAWRRASLLSVPWTAQSAAPTTSLAIVVVLGGMDLGRVLVFRILTPPRAVFGGGVQARRFSEHYESSEK